MKKLSLILISILFSLNTFAQKNEHSSRKNSLTIGSGLPIVQKTMLQLEHNLGPNWSMAENISYHYGLLGYTQIWSGPKLELLGRYYFEDQSIKYGKNWFAQIKAGAALFTNPLASVDGFDANAFLQEEVSGVTQAVLVGGERVPIFANANNWMSIGGGIAFGYKNINCNGWIFEAFIGYHYWSSPNYFTEEFKSWTEDPQNVYDANVNIAIDNIENGTDALWKSTYGFPVDLQIKVGKILNW